MQTRVVEVGPSVLNGMPMAGRDRLGFKLDSVLLTQGEHPDGGQVYTASHTRPMDGGMMHLFIESVAPYPSSHWVRKHTANIYRLPDHKSESPTYDDGSENESYRQHRLHTHIGKHGIGGAFMEFQADARDPWEQALSYDDTDTIYAPLSRAVIYRDFQAKTQEITERWLHELEDRSVRRGELMQHIINYTNVAAEPAVAQAMATARADYDERPFFSSKKRNAQIKEERIMWLATNGYLPTYIKDLPQNELIDAVGQIGSSYEDFGLGRWPAHKLIVDASSRQCWYNSHVVYDTNMDTGGLTDENEFPEPDFVLETPNSIRVNGEDGTFAEVEFVDTGHKELLDWRLIAYRNPTQSSNRGLFPSVAWRTYPDGSRALLDSGATRIAVAQSEIRIDAMRADNFLGRMMLKYFAEAGEYQASLGKRAWLNEMGLPGSSRKNPIRQRELPVWLALPQHQADLANANLLRRLESVANT